MSGDGGWVGKTVAEANLWNKLKVISKVQVGE